MKRKLLCIFIVLLATLLVLAACGKDNGVDINNGDIEVPDDVLAQLPFTVEVTGLEGVTGTAKVSLLDDAAFAEAMSIVRGVYYVANDATVYAVDIKIVDAEGKEIVVGKPVTVSFTMKADTNLVNNSEIFHVHDGDASQVVTDIDGNKASFTVETFSPFVLVPKHIHKYGEWHTYSEANCTDAESEIRQCVCGAIETRNGREALGHEIVHFDAVRATCTTDGNIEYYYCDKCGKYFSDAQGTNEITLNSIMLLAMGHFDANEDGKCGIELGQAPAEVPMSAEAVGAEGSVVNVTVQNIEGDQKNAALNLAKDAYYFDDGAELVVVDISAQGQLVANGSMVSVSVKLKDPKLPLDQYIVLHIYNGAVETIEPTVSGDCLTFYVSSFSPFVFGPKHMHSPSPFITDKEPGCTVDGSGHVECIKCKKVLQTKVLDATGHEDKDADGMCDKCGADLKETPDTLNSYVEGKVFKFDHAEGEGVNNATYATAYADATLTFFADNYMEYHVFHSVRAGIISAANVVLCGTYAIKESEGGFTITMTVTKRYYDDEETMVPIPTYSFEYNIASATVSIAEYPATLYYRAAAEAKPTAYTQPAFADNWNDAVIIDAFKAVGATKDYTFPKLDNVRSMTKSEVDMGQVTVTIVMSSKMQGPTEAKQYKSLLETQYYSYDWPNGSGGTETRVNTDDNLFRFVIATGNSEAYAVLTITISRFYVEYPEAGIANFLTEKEMTDAFPSFTTDWAMKYQFITDAFPALAYFHVQLRYKDGVEQHDADVAAEFKTLLQSTQYGYHEETIAGKAYLCSPNNQILMRVIVGKDGDSVDIYIYDASIIYPAAAINAYLSGTEDTFVDLDDDSVIGYALYTNEIQNPTALRLVGKFPASADAHLFVSGLEAAFAGAGYKWGGYSTHFGNEEDETLNYLAWMSPNNEIAVIFTAFNQGEHAFGDIAYYSVSIVNLTKIDANNKGIMTSLSASGHNPAVQVGNEYAFTGGIAFLYTNVGTELEGGGMYTNDLSLFDVGTIDTAIPGEKTLRISLKGNADIYTDVTILVLGLTGITATANLPHVDDRIAYYSTNYKLEKDYTITKYYSDGHTTTVKGNTEGITFGDINGAQMRQDLTISCTENGVTVSTTVAIGLFKAVNYSCTNEGAIDAGSAHFAIFAQGGTYGDGTWVAVDCEPRRKDFSGSVYMDAVGIYFVRLSPDLDVFGSLFYSLDNEGVLNKSDYIALPGGYSSGEFAFVGLDS